MGRLLILILLLVVAWIVLKRVARLSKRGGAERDSAASSQEKMLACALCGLHVPESEGVRVGDIFYCCEAHSRKANGLDAG